MPDHARCASCGAAILWARTPSDRKMPLDVQTCTDGNVNLMADGNCEVLSGADLEAARMAGRPLHKSHFATCPNATRHRKKK